MKKIELIERAKVYLQLLNNGVHPVTGKEIPDDSVFMDEKVKNCFTFVTEILCEYVEMSAKVEELEREKYGCRFTKGRIFHYARAVR